MRTLFLFLLLSTPVFADICPNCGVDHGQVRGTYANQAPQYSNEGLQVANRQRAQRGLGPLVYDAQMTAGAQQKVSRAAARGITGHQGGSFYGGNKEGVGHSSNKTFMACYLYTAPAGTRVGAAMAQGRRGWHSVLLLQHSGSLASKPGIRSGGRRFRRR